MSSSRNYIGSKFLTSHQKSEYFKALVKFTESGFANHLFTDNLYRRLSNSYGHIAHYDKAGFYDVWFGDHEQQNEWVQHVMTARVYGDPEFTTSDVEREFQTWLKEHEEQVKQKILFNGNKAKKVKQTSDDLVESRKAESCQDFIVCATSSNTGPFGHRRHFVLSKDGELWTIDVIPSNKHLPDGSVLRVPLSGGKPQWHRLGYVEVPTFKKLCDLSEVALQWGDKFNQDHSPRSLT